MTTMQMIGAGIFALALLHTFSAKSFEVLARLQPRHAGLYHLLGEVEVVFGFWAMLLIVIMAFVDGGETAIEYAESRHYTEPLFVFVVMVMAASLPILSLVQRLLLSIARMVPVRTRLAEIWLGVAMVPLIGSLITEPAAMTLAALMLAPKIFHRDMPEWSKYAALGVLFVNISIGGTLTSFAAPPVLMVAVPWNWDTAYMATHFGWRAALAVLFNATVLVLVLGKWIPDTAPSADADNRSARDAAPMPILVSLIHFGFLAGVIILAHHPVLFFGLFLFFLGYTQAYQQHQSPLILKEGLLVGFFLAGLVVLGGMQQVWLQPLVERMGDLMLFFGALGLTSITDNAALTYLGSLIEGMSDRAKYMLVAGAVAGGGLTVIANAPNPAGVALLRRGFSDNSISALGLLLGALAPTAVASFAFLM
jgi:hypothetical protein